MNGLLLKKNATINITIYIYTNKLINLINSNYQNWAHLTGFLIIKVYFKMRKLENENLSPTSFQVFASLNKLLLYI